MHNLILLICYKNKISIFFLASGWSYLVNQPFMSNWVSENYNKILAMRSDMLSMTAYPPCPHTNPADPTDQPQAPRTATVLEYPTTIQWG